MDSREVLAKNLCELRVAAGLTQLGLAEKMNYSDKAISKWERAESVPDIFVLKRLADFYGVSVDYLLAEEHPAEQTPGKVWDRRQHINRFISAIATMLVWFVATAYFVVHIIFLPDALLPGWMSFLYAIPASAIVMLVFNSMWGRRRFNYVIVTLLVWSIILALYLSILTLLGNNLWMLFLIGPPAQIVICLTAGLTNKKEKQRVA